MYSEEAVMALQMGAAAIQMRLGENYTPFNRGKHEKQGKKKRKKKPKVKHWRNN